MEIYLFLLQLEGKVYKYGYDNGLLTSIYDPQHTDAKPYKTSYAYENNRLVKVPTH